MAEGHTATTTTTAAEEGHTTSTTAAEKGHTATTTTATEVGHNTTTAAEEGHTTAGGSRPSRSRLDAQALRSEDGLRTVLRLVNWGSSPITALVPIRPRRGGGSTAIVALEQLAAPDGRPTAVNPPSAQDRVAIRRAAVQVGPNGEASVACPAFSLTVLRWGAGPAAGDQFLI